MPFGTVHSTVYWMLRRKAREVKRIRVGGGWLAARPLAAETSTSRMRNNCPIASDSIICTQTASTAPRGAATLFSTFVNIHCTSSVALSGAQCCVYGRQPPDTRVSSTQERNTTPDPRRSQHISRPLQLSDPPKNSSPAPKDPIHPSKPSSADMTDAYLFEGSKLQTMYHASEEDQRIISPILALKRPTPGKALEALVLDQVNFYIADNAVYKFDRPEAVVKMIYALQKLPIMQGMSFFPNKVGYDLVEAVRDFFVSRAGKIFLKEMFEPVPAVRSAIRNPTSPTSSYGTFPSPSGAYFEKGPTTVGVIDAMERASISNRPGPELQAQGCVSEKSRAIHIGAAVGNASDGRTLFAAGGGIIFFIALYFFGAPFLGNE
ncbi:hypothetical protein BDV96DRAFT_593458 [Lophiotrema nucula]|uniref:Uncharacterized protein n=1 Tax=Lophiotrema nucula TaxID=690887 RepID=A0A6A5ZW48_9PLEO|nr:hypothetical protein BDV96DRAFT_593458 [Lophiotrema nucula]